MTKNAWDSVGTGKDIIDEELEALREGAFYETIRNSAVRELNENFINMKLQVKLHNPDKLSNKNPEHLEQIQRYKPLIKQERCIRKPDDYIELAFSEHILDIRDKPPIRESYVDNKNISISSMVFLSKEETTADASEKSLEAGDYSQMLNAVGVAATVSGGVKVLGTGADLTGKKEFGAIATASAGEHWYIRSIKEQSRLYAKNVGQAAARTINAEEITFKFTADVQYCFNIKRRTNIIRSNPGGNYLLQ